MIDAFPFKSKVTAGSEKIPADPTVPAPAASSFQLDSIAASPDW